MTTVKEIRQIKRAIIGLLNCLQKNQYIYIKKLQKLGIIDDELFLIHPAYLDTFLFYELEKLALKLSILKNKL